MTRRSPARALAPIAVVAVVVALIAVIGASGVGGGGESDSSSNSASTTTPRQSTNRNTKREPATYTVRSGDSLTVISEKTGVSVQDLEDLNPDIDPAALQAGEKLKLR